MVFVFMLYVIIMCLNMFVFYVENMLLEGVIGELVKGTYLMIDAPVKEAESSI